MSEVTKKDLLMVPVDLIDVEEGFNIRTDMGNLEELADSIQSEGVKVAFRGYKVKLEGGEERFKVTDGHRRRAAALIVVERTGEMIKVPFVLEPKHYSNEQRVVDMFLTNDGKTLTVLEKGEGIQRMLNWEWKEAEIARKIGKSAGYVNRLVALMSAPKKLLNLVASKRVSGTYAMEIAGKGKEEVDKFLQDVESGTFDSPPPGEDELFEHPKEPSERAESNKKRITRKDAQAVNSLKELKGFIKMADPATMPEDKQKTYEFICKVFNNEHTERSIKLFFGRSACD